MRLLFVLAVLLMPSIAQATYQNPIVVSNERQPSGHTKLIFQFSGNAGEPVVVREYLVNPTSTASSLRNWVDGVISELNLMHTAASLPALQPGQTVPRLAPTTTAPTAKGVWRGKASMYNLVCGNGFAGALATACTTLKADIETTYQAGYLDVD